MFASHVSSRRPSRSSNAAKASPTSRAAFTAVERLEDRVFFAATLGGTFDTATRTDTGTSTGITPTDAAALPVNLFTTVDLINRPRQVLRDRLTGTSDTDTFRVSLRQGEFLAVDVDPVGSFLSTTSPPLWSSTITVTDGVGQVVPGTSPVAEPDSGVLSPNPAVGFVAPATGSYNIKVGTAAAAGHYSIERTASTWPKDGRTAPP